MDAISTNQVEKLRGRENFASWTFAMQVYLQSEDLWGCVQASSDYVADAKKMTRARAKIILALEKQNYTHIQDTITPKETWETLEKTFSDTGLTRKVGLLRNLTSIRLGECDSTEDYVARITSTAHKLKELKFEVKDEMVAALLLSGLPEEYKPMIMGLESSGAILTADAVKVKLLQEVRCNDGKEATDKQAAFLAKSSYAKSNKQIRKCYICNKPGHIANKCRYRQNKQTNEREPTSKTAFLATEKNPEGETWYLDSCASTHMTVNAHWLKDARELNSTIVTANEGKLTAVAKGNVELQVTKANSIEINNVLYVPKLAANLLSVSKIVEKGHTIIFDRSGCKIKNLNNKVVATAKSEAGVYKIERHLHRAWSAKDTGHEDEIWHRKLGHLNRKDMEILSKGMVTGIDNFRISERQCEQCIKGKISRLPFKRSGKRAGKPLELIHSDLCGPMSVNSIGGMKYFLTFVDDYSRKKFVYFLKHKSEVVDIFVRFKNLVENQTDSKIKKLRTDNGKEYVNYKFEQILQKSGIIHETTTPYTPEQNGVAERTNRTIVEKARTMLTDAELPKRFWAEATNTAVHLLNRSPMKAIPGMTPEEAWSGRKPNLAHLQIFGSEAMVHIPKVKRDKWDSKAQKLLFMGYAEDTKGYRLIDQQTRKITISRDVIFLNKEKLKVTHQSLNSPLTFTQFPDDKTDKEPEQDAGPEGPSDSEEEETWHPAPEERTAREDNSNVNEQNAPVESNTQTLRRSERKWKPVVKEGYISYYTLEQGQDDPQTVEEALKGPNRSEWMKAMNHEYEALKLNKTWEVVRKTGKVKPLTAKWVFKKKITNNQEPIYKARLVVRGCAQTSGIDYFETYSPVVRYNTIRYLLALAAKEDLEITQMDVTTAYLNSDLMEDIYVQPPKGLEKREGVLWKLNKAMYGLKQSGRAWYQRLDDTLKKQGLEKSKTDPCVYFYNGHNTRLIIAIYVDDLLIFSNNIEKRKRLQEKLKEEFTMKDLGNAKQFLGMIIERDQETIKIHQKEYVERTLQKFGMSECKPVGTPMDPGTKSQLELHQPTEEEIQEGKNIPYLEAVGSLLYISQISRPDIAYAVNFVSSFSKSPCNVHWNAVKHIFRYIKGTLDYKLAFSKCDQHDLIGYSDADWANDPKTRRSITGTVFTMCGGPISWYSKRQRTVALSTVEAEYIALAFSCQEGLWLRNLRNEIEPKMSSQPLQINCDSSGAINLSKNATTKQRTKHIDLRHHFVQENVEAGIIVVQHLNSEEMTADILTKPLSKPKTKYLAEKLGLITEN